MCCFGCFVGERIHFFAVCSKNVSVLFLVKLISMKVDWLCCVVLAVVCWWFYQADITDNVNYRRQQNGGVLLKELKEPLSTLKKTKHSELVEKRVMTDWRCRPGRPTRSQTEDRSKELDAGAYKYHSHPTHLTGSEIAFLCNNSRITEYASLANVIVCSMPELILLLMAQSWDAKTQLIRDWTTEAY